MEKSKRGFVAVIALLVIVNVITGVLLVKQNAQMKQLKENAQNHIAIAEESFRLSINGGSLSEKDFHTAIDYLSDSYTYIKDNWNLKDDTTPDRLQSIVMHFKTSDNAALKEDCAPIFINITTNLNKKDYTQVKEQTNKLLKRVS